jgi:hypothetical protein
VPEERGDCRQRAAQPAGEKELGKKVMNTLIWLAWVSGQWLIVWVEYYDYLKISEWTLPIIHHLSLQL